jgi:hypothetical protein
MEENADSDSQFIGAGQKRLCNPKKCSCHLLGFALKRGLIVNPIWMNAHPYRTIRASDLRIAHCSHIWNIK